MEGQANAYSRQASGNGSTLRVKRDSVGKKGQLLGSPLSKQEKEVADLMLSDLGKKEIASKLFISIHTVKTHIRTIYLKLGCHTAIGFVLAYQKYKGGKVSDFRSKGVRQ